MNLIKQNKRRLLDIICILFILVVCLYNLGNLNRVKIIDDEFGYWGIAALVNGLDWADLMATTEYYAYGYSVLLVPLLFLHKLGVGMSVLYQVAIVLNALMLIAVYYLTQYVGKKIFSDLPEGLVQIVSLAMTVYIGYTTRTHSAWSETYLLLMFWCVVALFLRFIEKPTCKNSFWLVLATANIFAIHMRAAGVVVAVFITLFFYFVGNFKKIDKKCMIFTVLLAVALFVGLSFVKEYVTNNMYFDQVGTSVNDVSRQVKKTKSLLSVSGLADLMMSMIGKFYYTGAATFLLGLIGFVSAVFAILKTIFNLLKKKEITDGFKQWFLFMTTLAFLGEIAISAIFNCVRFFSNDATKTVHLDSISYGRYHDFAIGPMLLLGIWVLYYKREHVKEILLAALFFFFSAFVVQYQYDIMYFYNGADVFDFRLSAVPWLAILYQGIPQYFGYYAAFISVLLFAAIYLLCSFDKSKRYGLTTAILLMALGWGIGGMVYSKEFVDSKISKDKTVDTVKQMILETDKEVPIYLVTREKDEAIIDVKVLQWSLGNRGIEVYALDELQEINLQQAILLCDSSDVRVKGTLSDTAEYLYNSGSIAVFVNQQNANYEVLKAKAKDMSAIPDRTEREIDLTSVVTDYSFVKSNGSLYYNYKAKEGYMTEGMGLSLEDGIYEFMIDLRAKEGVPGSDMGYITVGEVGGEIQDTVMLRADDFAQKDRQIVTVKVCVSDGTEPFVGVYTFGDAAFRIYGISYRRATGGLQLDSEEITQIIDQTDKEGQIFYVDSNNSAEKSFPVCEAREMSYLSGDILEYRENYADAEYIVEKTDAKAVQFFRNKLLQVYETENYALFR